MIPYNEIEFVNGNMILGGLILIALYLIWDLSRIKLEYTIHTFECLKCGYKYKGKHNSIRDLVMFYHRIVCRGKENDK